MGGVVALEKKSAPVWILSLKNDHGIFNHLAGKLGLTPGKYFSEVRQHAFVITAMRYLDGDHALMT